MDHNLHIKQLLNQVKIYLAYLQYERKLSTNTIKSYLFDLKHFIDFIVSQYNVKVIEDVRSKHIRGYIASLNTYMYNNIIFEKQNSSINRAISSVKNYFKYLVNNDFIKKDPTKAIIAPKQNKKLPITLTVEEINDPVSNVSVSDVTGLKFDVDGGFALTDNSDGTVTITLESTFKTWHVYDTASDTTPTDIVASAVDEIDIRAGNNITLTPVTTAGAKGITIASDISDLLDLGISDSTAGQVLQTDGNGNFTFTNNSITSNSIPTSQAFTGDGSTVDYTLTDSPADEESIDVYVNDVLQRPSIYSLSGTTLSFNETPANNDEIYVKYRYPNATNVSLVNNSVENQHLDLIYTSNQYTGDNTTTQYTIPTGHTVDSVLAIVDGLLLQPTEYSISGATLTFTTAPSTSSTVDFRYFPI